MTDTGVVVATTYGTVRGARHSDGVHGFLGVPYAAAPVGALRFAAPQPHPGWADVRDATAHGPTAPQAAPSGLLPMTLIDGDECLNVNLYTPDPGAAGLPVLVWIHGGGYVMGSNGDDVTNGARLAARGIVVVAINYRLGVDGFLPLPDAPSNRAVRDWIAALEWVRENIGAFGGDPQRVTICGQSAGSAACLNLLSNPANAHLFRGVVAMSGVPFNNAHVDEVVARGDDLVRRLGVERSAAALGSVPLDALLAVQNEVAPMGGVDASAIGDAMAVFAGIASYNVWLGPVVDGEVVPRPPADAFAAGAGADTPLMIGSTAQEMDALMSLVGATCTADEASAQLLRAGLSSGDATAWLDLAPRSPAAALGSALTHISFTEPVHRLAGLRHNCPASTFVYEFAWTPPTLFGTVHGFDLPYFFDNTDVEAAALFAGGEPPKDLADEAVDALVGFVTSGDPGFPAYGAERSTHLFDRPSRQVNDPIALARRIFRDRQR